MRNAPILSVLFGVRGVRPAVVCCLFVLVAVTPIRAEPPVKPTPPRAESAGLRRFEFRRTLMGVPFAVAFYASDEGSANNAIDAVWKHIDHLNSVMSDYDSASELMRVCRDSAPGKPVRVSPELFVVLSKAASVSEASDGAFDVTVGPLVKLWRRARRQKEMPDARQLEEARAVVGWRNVRLRCEDCSSELLKPGIKLDLGGIAVGYACDEGIKLLKDRGITRAMLDGSGDIVVSDPPPGETGWRIGIASLKEPDAEPTVFARLANCSISTSGDAYQFVELGGKRYSHIVDPKTGLGLTDRHSVTVIAPDGITADSLATAVCVLGPDRGLKLIESQPNTAALFATLDGDRLVTRKSSRFESFAGKQVRISD